MSTTFSLSFQIALEAVREPVVNLYTSSQPYQGKNQKKDDGLSGYVR